MSTGAVVDCFTSLVLTNDVAVPVAAMNALVVALKHSEATTWMELEDELRSAIAALKRCRHEDLGGRTNLSLGSGCDLFMKYVTRAFKLESMEFDECKAELLRRGEKFADMSMHARSYIADIGHSFISEESTVLVHGDSRVVSALILKAAESKQFKVIVTEGRPGADGAIAARRFTKAGIPTKMVLDSAVASIIDQVDLCLCGAEGVMENGGIVNKTGTYQVAIVAKALNKPFYVAVESYKFARMYPLTQRDIMDMCYIEEDALDFKGGEEEEKNHDSDGLGDSSIGLNETLATEEDQQARKVGKNGGPELELPRSGSGDNLIILNNLNNSNSVDIALQMDMSWDKDTIAEGGSGSQEVKMGHTLIDFTPAEYITLLFTDLGVLTPAAVSDELIRLYQ
jgi:translation initiation factor eIF-2B subunit alpha